MPKDPYVHEDNGILINKLGITNYDILRSAEKDITFSKFLNIDTTFQKKFDISYLKSIHKHIFEDIFDWAGEFRTIPIEKTEIVIPGLSLQYAPVKDISNLLEPCLEKMNSTNWNGLSLDEKAATFTTQLTELWKIHPFRDGNTRTTITFARQFSKEHGFPMDLSLLLDNLSRKTDENGKITRYSIRDKFVLSAIPKEYYPEPEHLNFLIRKSMISGISKNISDLQSQLDGTER